MLTFKFMLKQRGHISISWMFQVIFDSIYPLSSRLAGEQKNMHLNRNTNEKVDSLMLKESENNKQHVREDTDANKAIQSILG